MNLKKAIIVVMLFILSLGLFASLPHAYAYTPGTAGNISPAQYTTNSLASVVTELGKISLSIDGIGTNQPSGTIQVKKPAGATVRKAYMMAATIWNGGHIANDQIQIDGANIAWSVEIPNVLSSYNYWTEVTSMVKAKIDAAPAGLVDFTIKEIYNNYYIDGEILVVIFDDPNQASDNTVVLFFGSQDQAGDTFAIGLGTPIDPSDPNLVLDLSLGISYSYQYASAQYSIVDVNGQRLTSWAGGEDDGAKQYGEHGNGALITAGGIGDTNANPADPYANPVGDWRYDDELYSLKPFVQKGDTSINVFTQNPSYDDNVMFAALFMSTAAVVGEGILLTPVSATNYVNNPHTLTALVQDSNGNPIIGRDVTFTIESGPNAGMTHTEPTDNNGKAYFTYTGTTLGTDVIVATTLNSQGQPMTSNEATKLWKIFVIPEYRLGTILGIAGSFLAFGMLRFSKRKHP